MRSRSCLNAGISQILSIKLYGSVTLEQSLKIQDKTLELRKKRIILDTFLFFELEDCWTTGRLDKFSDKLNLEVAVLDRGGGATYHGPGQLVCYPIIWLSNYPETKKYLRWLEQLMIEALNFHGLKCHAKERYTGIWIDDRKIGFIGVKTSQGFTKHGFSINLTCDLGQFDKIVACGIKDVKITSYENETGKKLLPAKLTETFAKILSRH